MLSGMAQKFSPPAAGPWWRRTWLLGVLTLFLPTLLLFAPVGGFDFIIFDDQEYVAANPHLNRGFTGDGVVWAFTKSHSANWHPLTWLSHMLDCQLWGLQAGPHHWHNVILHALNAVLVFGWLRAATGRTLGSWFVAALFAWHPLHVESVAWVSERKDVLSTFWGLISLWCYTCHQQSAVNPAGKRPMRCYWLAVVSFALGLMSKPMLVTWPFVLLLLDFWPLQRWDREPARQLLREKWPFLALSFLSCLVTFLVQSTAGATSKLNLVSIDYRLGNAVNSYALYLWQTIWPRDLLVFYPCGELIVWRVALAFVLLLVLSVLIWRCRRQLPWAGWGWCWYLGTLVPVIGLVQVGSQALANRYMYIPSIGIFIGLVWSAEFILQKYQVRRLWLPVGMSGILLGCMLQTATLLPRWKDSISLFQPVCAAFPEAYFAHLNLGLAYSNEAKYPEAYRHLREAIRLEPKNSATYNDLGRVFSKNNRTTDAIACFRQAIALSPDFFAAYKNLGLELEKTGPTDEALEQYRQAERLNPDHAELQYLFANAHQRRGQWPEAIARYQHALRLQPDHIEAHNNLALAYSQAGQPDAAAAELEQTLRLKPDLVETRVNLGALLIRQGNYPDAIRHLSQAVQLNPEFPAAHLNLGLARARNGQWAEAAGAYQKYVTLLPDQPEGRLKLADALLHLNQPQAARDHLETALRSAQSLNRPDLVSRAEQLLRALPAPASNPGPGTKPAQPSP